MNIKEIVSSANKLPYKELCTALIDRFAVKQPVNWESVMPYAMQQSLFGGEILRLISDHPTLANQKEIRPVCVMRGELSQLLFFYLQLKDEKLSRSVIERINKKFVGGPAAGRYVIWFFGNNNADALKIVISGKEGKKIRLKTLTLEAGHWFKTYDYILGEVERRFTPASTPPLSFPPLLRGGDRGGDLKEPSGLYKAIWEAFDISIVNKKFYAEIKGVFEALTKEELPRCKGVLTNEKERVQFAIRLIGRVIFCWFLKRKDIISDDVLSSKAVQSTPNYYRSLLEPLFFDVFNTPRNERRKELPDSIKDYPFLNGGLFEPQRQDCKDNWSLYIPNDWFEGFFSNTLEKYNFTVDENTAASAEIAIDPEMLGRIFENLLAEQNPETGESARKATGSYYTPREIVDFMVEESLIAYLKGNPDNIKIIPSPLAGEGKGEGEFNNAVEDFVHTGTLPDALKPHSKELLEKLNTVKVLDPACGSGAFPISMLQKLVALKQQLSPDVGDNKLYDIKLKTIENSIYGVDIQPMATELSRLRCWLSLIVDEDTKDIKPLPNLDFKFVTANSLIDLEYDEFIHKVETGKIGGLFLADFINKLNELRLIRQNYFYTVANAKENNQRIPSLEKGGKVYIPSPLTGEGEGGGELCGSSSKDKLKKEFNTIKSDLFDLSMKLINQGFTDLEFANKINKWNPFDDSEAAPFFNSEWMFGIPSPSPFEKGAPLKIPSPLAGEGRGEGGFDIVIGNPPYIRQEDLKALTINGHIINLKEVLRKQNYEVFNSTSDIYTYFYEKGWQVLKEKGHLTLITSNKWMRAKYGEKLRQFFKEKTALKQIIDFGGHKVFESATVDTNILICQKNVVPRYVLPMQIITVKSDFTNTTDLAEYFRQNSISMYQSDLDSRCFTFGNDAVMQLKKKIEQIGTPLKDWDVRICFGIKTGFNEAFIIDNETKESLCKGDPKSAEILKPILRGRDIQRYGYKWAGLWLIKIESGWTNKHRGKNEPEVFLKNSYPAVYNHLNAMGEKTGKGKGLYQRDDQGDYWWELRDCAYYEEFEKEKIIYPNMTKYRPFLYDTEIFYTNQKCYIMTGNTNTLKYLIALLNSWLFDFAFKDYFPELLGGTRELNKVFFETIPIPKILEKAQEPFITLVDKILAAKQNPPSPPFAKGGNKEADTAALERQIDEMVYKLYDLTPEEIKVVENSTK